jgi:hypothetical protein
VGEGCFVGFSKGAGARQSGGRDFHYKANRTEYMAELSLENAYGKSFVAILVGSLRGRT